jgi:hypothetical protein
MNNGSGLTGTAQPVTRSSAHVDNDVAVGRYTPLKMPLKRYFYQCENQVTKAEFRNGLYYHRQAINNSDETRTFQNTINSIAKVESQPVPVAARSKATARLLGIAGSDTTGGMDVCLL